MVGFRADDLLLFFRAARVAPTALLLRAARPSDQGAGFAAGNPVILLGGILTGWSPPTEPGVVAIVYILVVVIPVLNRGHLPPPAAGFWPMQA